MMKNIAVVKQGGRYYMFSVPNEVVLNDGDTVKCDTKYGETDGIVVHRSIWADDDTIAIIAKITGATLPLKSVVGKVEVVRFA